MIVYLFYLPSIRLNIVINGVCFLISASFAVLMNLFFPFEVRNVAEFLFFPKILGKEFKSQFWFQKGKKKLSWILWKQAWLHKLKIYEAKKTCSSQLPGLDTSPIPIVVSPILFTKLNFCGLSRRAFQFSDHTKKIWNLKKWLPCVSVVDPHP